MAEQSTLPPDLWLRIVALASFREWLHAWRPVCRTFAQGPEWFAPCAPHVRVVASASRADLQSIIDEMGRAPPLQFQEGPILLLLPGAYSCPLRLHSPITVIGWGPRGVVQLTGVQEDVFPNSPDAWLLLEDGCQNVKVCNLTLSVPAGPWAICVAGGAPMLSKCDLLGGGVTLRGGTAILSHCTINDSDGVGVLVESAARPQLLHCSISRARYDGVQLEAPARLEGCRIESSGRHGLHISSGVDVDVSELQVDNSFAGNGRRVPGNDVYVDEFDCYQYAIEF